MFLRKPVLSLLHNHLIFYPTPANLTYFWGFGSLSGLFLASQMLTGVFLAMHYTPHVDLAFASLEHIMRDVNNGWFIRYLHANGASFFFFSVYVHIGRTIYFGFYHNSRKYLWFSGIIIFFLMMAIAFMGYVLPWGQMSFWGATVITNLFSAIPVIGEDIAYWLWGGFSVGNATLVRFFSFHYCLPFVLAGVALVHLVLLHLDGSSNPLGIEKSTDKISFYPYFYVKDYFGFMALFTFYFFVVSYYPDVLGHSDNYIEANALVTPVHIVPEWYFLPFYAILRAVPNKLGGVLLMALSIAILAILPFYQVKQRSLFIPGRFVYLWSFWLFAFCVIFLGYLGGLPIESPYTAASQIFALYYFLFFSLFVFFDLLLNSVMFKINAQTTLIAPVPVAGYLVTSQHSNQSIFNSWITGTLRQHAQFLLALRKLYSKMLQHLIPKIVIQTTNFRHPYHLVNASPWPFFVSLSLLAVTMGTVLYLHSFTFGGWTVLCGFFLLLFSMVCWFRDVIREGTFEGHHTLLVQRGLKSGMLLFIVSEVMFFFAFFWGFFHSSLAPAIQIGGIWPPLGIAVFNPWEIPLLNTLILLTSGATVTWAHYAIRSNFVRSLRTYAELSSVRLTSGNTAVGFLVNQRFASHPGLVRSFAKVRCIVNFFLAYSGPRLTQARDLLKIDDGRSRSLYMFASIFRRSRHDFLFALLLTIVLGLIFTLIQFYEYKHSTFTISDSVYGSTFFLTTGFHGLHVLIGTLFLIVCFFRGVAYHFTRQHHIGLESAIWYWHFVDVVWLGLYISVYHWGGAVL